MSLLMLIGWWHVSCQNSFLHALGKAVRFSFSERCFPQRECWWIGLWIHWRKVLLDAAFRPVTSQTAQTSIGRSIWLHLFDLHSTRTSMPIQSTVILLWCLPAHHYFQFFWQTISNKCSKQAHRSCTWTLREFHTQRSFRTIIPTVTMYQKLLAK